MAFLCFETSQFCTACHYEIPHVELIWRRFQWNKSSWLLRRLKILYFTTWFVQFVQKVYYIGRKRNFFLECAVILSVGWCSSSGHSHMNLGCFSMSICRKTPCGPIFNVLGLDKGWATHVAHKGRCRSAISRDCKGSIVPGCPVALDGLCLSVVPEPPQCEKVWRWKFSLQLTPDRIPAGETPRPRHMVSWRRQKTRWVPVKKVEPRWENLWKGCKRESVCLNVLRQSCNH